MIQLEKIMQSSIGGGVALIYLSFPLQAKAAVLVDYQFPTAPNNGGVFILPTNTAANLTAGNINITGSTLGAFAGGSPPNYLLTNNLATNAANAVSQNKYFQFSVTPKASFELDLTSLTFDASRGGASTPRGWVVRSSLDNYASDIATANISTQVPTFTNFSVNLSRAAYQNITQSVNFRIYGYAPLTSSQVDFDNITLNGTNVQVPEPSSTLPYALLIGGLGVAKLMERTHFRDAPQGTPLL